LSFLLKIDSRIKDLENELAKTRNARIDKSFHINFVSQKLNDLIRDLAKNNPENPAQTLGEALTKVSDIIGDSFDHIERVESNIFVTINAYNRIKDDFIAYENKEKQSAQQPDQKNREIRSVGTRPENKLKERKKKIKKKSKKRD